MNTEFKTEATQLAYMPAPEDIGHIRGLTLNVPDWFEDPQFSEWLNSESVLLFSWHTKGAAPTEYSDTVVTLEPSCSGEGSASDMPERFWNAIVAICEAQLGKNNSSFHYFVRLTNLAS